MRAAIDRRISKGNFRVIPVLLPGGNRGERSKLPTFLTQTTWVEFPQSLDDKDAFHRLKSGILGIAPGPSSDQPIFAGVCPYRGLEVFDVEHQSFFFGRDALTEWLLDELKPKAGQPANRFLAIVGASGSGKSSLARAGLIAALKQGALEHSHEWPIYIVKPGYDPLENLALQLASDPRGFKTLRNDLLTDSEQLHLTTRFMLRDKPDTHRVVVLIDQFEEVFTLCRDGILRQALIDNLVHAANEPLGQTVVLLTMRADFYGRCAEYENLAAALADHQLLIGPMSEPELHDAIVKPLQLTGHEFESGLVDVLIQDFKGQAGSLPLLQYALTQLWEQRQDRLLTHAGYKAIGKLDGALEKRANAIYQRFSAEEQEVCRQIFLRLTEPGEGIDDTRRRASHNELAKSETTEKVLKALTDARLVTTEGDSDKIESFIEVSHEALIRSWSQLRRWVDDDREALLIQHRLSEATREWVEHRKDNAYLYRGSRLSQVEEWAQSRKTLLSEYEEKFLRESLNLRDEEIRQREKQQRKLLDQARALASERETAANKQKKLSQYIGIVAVVAAILAAFAVIQWQETDGAKKIAEENKRIADDSAKRAGEQAKKAEKATQEATKQRQLAEQARQDTERSLARFFAVEAADRLDANTHGPLKLLLAKEAIKIAHTTETDQAVRKILTWIQGEPINDHKYTDDSILENIVFSVAFSPDGHTLASASISGNIKLWNLNDLNSEPKVLHNDKITNMNMVFSIAFSPDSHTLASGGAGGSIKLWNLNDQNSEPKVLAGCTFMCRSVAFSADGNLLASSGEDHTVRVWNMNNLNAEPRILRGHKSSVRSVAFNTDRQLLASASQDSTILLWDAKNLNAQPVALDGHEGFVHSVAFSADGNLLASSGEDRTVRLWNLDNLDAEPKVLRGHEGSVLSVAFSTDGSLIASAGFDYTVRLWNLDNLDAEPKVLRGHEGSVLSVAFKPNSHSLISSSANDIRLWNVKNLNAQPHTLDGHEGFVHSVAFSADGNLLASSGEDRTVRVWNMNNLNAEPRILRGHKGRVQSVVFNANRQLLASASQDSTIRLWDIENLNAQPHTLNGHEGAVLSVAFSADGNLLASSGEDRTVRVWNMNNLNAEPRILRGHKGRVQSVAFNANRQLLASASQDSTIRLWDIENLNAQPHTLNGHEGAVLSVAFSADGNLLASSGEDRTVRAWNLSSLLYQGEDLNLLPGLHPAKYSPSQIFLAEKPFTSVAFSADSNFLASSNEDGTIHLRNIDGVRTDQLPIMLSHQEPILSLTFSPDGRLLVSASRDTLFLWKSADDLVFDACQRSGRNMTLKEWRYYWGVKPYKRSCMQWPLPHDLVLKESVWFENKSFELIVKNLVDALQFDGADEKILEIEARETLVRHLVRKIQVRPTQQQNEWQNEWQTAELIKNWAAKNNYSDTTIQRLYQWLKDLEANQNPFDEATLKKLRDASK